MWYKKKEKKFRGLNWDDRGESTPEGEGRRRIIILYDTGNERQGRAGRKVVVPCAVDQSRPAEAKVVVKLCVSKIGASNEAA